MLAGVTQLRYIFGIDPNCPMTTSTHDSTAAPHQALARFAELTGRGAGDEALGVPRTVNPVQLNGMIGSVAHLAYHLGAVRQIDRSIKGPSEAGSPNS